MAAEVVVIFASMSQDRPPQGIDARQRALLERMCVRAGVEFTEWECARLLTEFKRKLTEAQWATLREDPEIRTPADALRVLIVFGFENRRLERLHLRARGRDRVWAEPEQQQRIAHLLGRERPPPKTKGIHRKVANEPAVARARPQSGGPQLGGRPARRRG